VGLGFELPAEYYAVMPLKLKQEVLEEAVIGGQLCKMHNFSRGAPVAQVDRVSTF